MEEEAEGDMHLAYVAGTWEESGSLDETESISAGVLGYLAQVLYWRLK